MAQDRFQWQHLVIPLMSLGVPLKVVSVLPGGRLSVSQERYCFITQLEVMSLISWSSYLESNSCSASLEIVSIQWNPKVEPFSQEPAQGSYPDESSPHNPIPFKTHFNFFSHLDLGLRGGFFISGFPYKILWVFIFAYTHTNSSTYSSP
jgi:hypothetical protein